MKKAFLSALIVVAIYFIILVSLQNSLRMDPSEGGVGWLYVIFVIGGTPAFLIIAVIVFFTNYYLHRNPNSPLALKNKTKAFQYPRNISLLYLVVVITIEVLLNIAYPSRGLSPEVLLYANPIVFYILSFIGYLVGSKEDKKKRDSMTSK